MAPTHSPNEVPAAERGLLIDLGATWRVIVKRRWLIVAFFVAVVLVTAVATVRMTKVYDATCTIIIDLAAPRVLEQDQVRDVVETGAGIYFSREYYRTQHKVITSRAVMQRVAEQLHLGSNPRFVEGEAAVGGDARDPGQPERDPVAVLEKNLKVELVRDSRVVLIRYEDPDPHLAATIANAIADAYIAENLAVRSSTTASASDWLEQQLADLERKLEDSARALFEFKKSHDIVAASWEDRQGMVSQRLTAINESLAKARVRKAELQARNDSIEARGGAAPGDEEAVHQAVSSTAIQALRGKYFEARAECADLRVKYLDGHPKLASCQEKLAIAKNALDAEIGAARATVRLEYQEILKTERNLVALLESTKADAFGLNQYEREYLELKRAYDNNQRLYELVLRRLKDTGITGTLRVSNVRILDRARPSRKPARPAPLLNLAIAMVVGALGGVALAFLAERLDTSITSQEQIEERLGLTLLGVIPSVGRREDGSARDLVVHDEPRSIVAECVRTIRTNLLFMSPETPLRKILVTSSGPQEGKTTVAVSLAVTMARNGERVLLMDADMRRPRIHSVFGASSAAGLSSLILGQGDPAEVIRTTAIANLSILACGPVPPNPTELLHTSAFRGLMAELATRYDRVIVDSPPVGMMADAAVMATHADGTLLVVKAGRTTHASTRHAARQLRDVKARVLGAVLNDLDLASDGGSYAGYGAYYADAPGRDAGEVARS